MALQVNATLATPQDNQFIEEIAGRLIYTTGGLSEEDVITGNFSGQFYVPRKIGRTISNQWVPGLRLYADGKRFNVDAVVPVTLFTDTLCTFHLSNGQHTDNIPVRMEAGD